MRINQKFTLIEMLIVIAIIGVLLTILLPSLNKARKASRTASTISNLKQMYQGTVSYTVSNDGNIFLTSTNYHVRQDDKTTNWTRMVFEEIIGELLPGGTKGARRQMKKGTTYYSLMYCPVLRMTRPGGKQHPQGRSDFGMNRHFRDAYRKIAQLEGKKEPFIMPATRPGDSHALPDLNHAEYNPSSKTHPIYEYNNSKSVALFIDGNIRFISISEGAALETAVNRRSDFK